MKSRRFTVLQGKRWVKLDNSAFQRQVGLNPTSASGNQPQTFFEYYDNVGESDIEEVGSEGAAASWHNSLPGEPNAG